MNKVWLTSFTVAGIVGSAGAAFAGVTAIHSASAESAPATSESAATSAVRTITYRIGSAGVVTLATDGTMITITDSTASDGWSLLSTSPAGAHVEVQFTDGQQLVTFLADQVGNDVAVSLTNVEAPGAPATTSPVPMKVTIIGHQEHDVPATHPAPTPPPTTVGSHGTVAPPTASTTKPSATQGDDDEHEYEGEESDD